MAQTASRMNHIFGTDGRTFILAMDHGSNFNVLPAMKDTKKLIRELAAAGADAFLSTIGMAENFADSFLGKGIILRIDGGVSFLGGVGNPWGVVCGALILQLLQNGMNLMGVDPNWNKLVQGAAIIVAVLIDYLSYRKNNSR